MRVGTWRRGLAGEARSGACDRALRCELRAAPRPSASAASPCTASPGRSARMSTAAAAASGSGAAAAGGGAGPAAARERAAAPPPQLDKAHTSAVCIVPPATLWGPIQHMRVFADKSFVRCVRVRPCSSMRRAMRRPMHAMRRAMRPMRLQQAQTRSRSRLPPSQVAAAHQPAVPLYKRRLPPGRPRL